MNDGKLRAEFPRKPPGPLEDRTAALSEINRAHDAAEADGLVTGSLFQVGTRPHRAPGVVQHLGGHGTQKKPPEWPVSMSRHDDQVDIVVPRIVDDLSGRIAFHHLLG